MSGMFFSGHGVYRNSIYTMHAIFSVKLAHHVYSINSNKLNSFICANLKHFPINAFMVFFSGKIGFDFTLRTFLAAQLYFGSN